MASSGGSKKSTRGLALLNTLVLHRVCTFFCTHCEPTPLELEGCQDESQSKATLRNLCQASRLLRSVAEPVLYHYAQFQYLVKSEAPDHFVSSSLRFMRNIHDRPQLRNHVKVLDVRDHAQRHRNCNISFYPTCANWQDRLNWRNRQPVTERSLLFINQLAAPFGIKCVADDFVLDRLVETFAQLMLVLLPGLTELRLMAQGCWTFGILSGALERKSTETLDTFLSKVRKLHLKFLVSSCDCNKCLSHKHLRFLAPLCERSKCLSQNKINFTRGAERLLIKATASNLHTLICPAKTLSDAPDLPGLESLRVDMRGAWPGYSTFLP
ncbi:unnamed protein product [Clonostachys rosea]|uniref:F-box domain-containing protein n=1 Tax=Bionectria ochroleuca TaxID=29856 RepID=A0ABY6ULR0_BIOOC|nr:unnamed protein product [Clonostachys rosea]